MSTLPQKAVYIGDHHIGDAQTWEQVSDLVAQWTGRPALAVPSLQACGHETPGEFLLSVAVEARAA